MIRPDFSKYVAHFTKEPKTEEGHEFKGMAAYDRLIHILQKKTIFATTMPWTNKLAVAFTECPFWSMMDHVNRYSPHGIGLIKEKFIVSVVAQQSTSHLISMKSRESLVS